MNLKCGRINLMHKSNLTLVCEDFVAQLRTPGLCFSLLATWGGKYIYSTVYGPCHLKQGCCLLPGTVTVKGWGEPSQMARAVCSGAPTPVCLTQNQLSQFL